MNNSGDDRYNSGSGTSNQSGWNNDFGNGGTDWGSNGSNDPYAGTGNNDAFGGDNFGGQNDGFGDLNSDPNTDFGDNGTDKSVSTGASNEVLVKDPNMGLSTTAICSFLGVATFVQGVFIGGLFGVIHSGSEAMSQGIFSQPGIKSQILKNGAINGVTFGVWLGTFQSSKCFLKKSRGTDDMFNSFLAGNAAGMVGALRTRNPRSIIISGLASGFTMTILDSIQGPTGKKLTE